MSESFFELSIGHFLAVFGSFFGEVFSLCDCCIELLIVVLYLHFTIAGWFFWFFVLLY